MAGATPTDQALPRDIQDRLELAVRAARAAGRLTLKYFQRADAGLELKPDDTPVTRADREGEQLLRKSIGRHFPDDDILGEEFGEKQGGSGFRWILDPLDGTKTFIRGVPLYGTLVGVEKDDEVVLGVIVLPAVAEYLYAARGGGSWHSEGGNPPAKARVSGTRALAEATFCYTSLGGFVETRRVGALEKLTSATRLSRGWGDCYGYALVATGRVDVMIDPQMNVWDCAALKPIIEEAGGSFTDWRGTPTIYGGESLATNGHLQEQVLDITRSAG